jgi:hypothetical protein
MKRGPLLLLLVLTAAALLLALNYLEPDAYENHLPGPPPPGPNVDADDGALWRILPSKVIHACPVCGDCTHPVELLGSRRTMSLVDHDGWYRLFWAGDEVYHFDDPVFLVAATTKRTAGAASGRWTIKARVGPGSHDPAAAPHACTEVAREVELDYALEVGPDPAPAGSFEQAGLQVPGLNTWLLQRIDTKSGPRFVAVAWRLASSPKLGRGPCNCSK